MSGLYQVFYDFVGVPAQMASDPIAITITVVIIMCCALIALDFFDMIRDFAFIFTKIF